MSKIVRDYSVATNLKKLRKALGWSQAELAEKLGTDNTHISAWENGLRKPTYDNCLRLIRIAAMNNVKVDAAFLRPDKAW